LKKRGKKRGLPNWHALFDGPETTKQLARRVGEGVTYATFYGLYSDAIHGSNAFDHMAPAENGVGQSVRPIRHPFWINKASSQAGQLAVFLVAKLLKTYAPEQIEAFHRRYQVSLRPMMRSLVGPDAMDAPWG
jgi:hypothetical protein